MSTVQWRILWLDLTIDWTAGGGWKWGGSWNKRNAKDLTDILPAIDMAAEKLCDIDPDWECSSTVKRGIRAMLHPYYEFL